MGRRLAAEFLGTALLLLAIVGSGITASTDGAASSQLFQHAVVVGAALAALVLTFGHVSGGHFNPAVTLVDAAFGGMTWRSAAQYVVVQAGGAVVGVVTANLLFGLSAVTVASTPRTGLAIAASESVATFGLLVVVFGVVHSGRVGSVPAAVGGYIGAAIYFTSSAAFANPAVTVARTLTDTYTGIAPAGVLGFVVAQALGASLAAVTIRWLFHPDTRDATNVMVPHGEPASTTATPRTGASR